MPTLREAPSGDARWDIGPEGEIATGIRCRWNDKTKIVAIETHYSADPAKRTVEWLASERAGTKNWEVEYELAWRHYSGKAVYGATFGDIHVAQGLTWDRSRPLLAGWDFGRDPCAIFGQMTPDWRLHIVGEVLAPDRMSVTAFAPYYLAYVAERFPGMVIKHAADPAGWAKGQQSEDSCIDVLRSIGVVPSKGEIRFTKRIADVEYFLKGLVGGKPQFQIDEAKAPFLLEAFRGGYQYPKLHTQGGSVVYASMPDKNDSSHPSDACQYLCGLARRMASAAAKPQRPLDQKAWKQDWSGRSSRMAAMRAR